MKLERCDVETSQSSDDADELGSAMVGIRRRIPLCLKAQSSCKGQSLNLGLSKSETFGPFDIWPYAIC